MFSSEAWLANPSSGFYNGVATQSLRFDDGSSARLQKTPSASNRKVWTWSAWVKRSSLGASRAIWSVTSSAHFAIFFNSDDSLRVWVQGGNGAIYTNRLFRDTSAWYHIALTSKNSGNYLELYINGVKETSFSYDNRANYPAGNDLEVNSNDIHYLGTWNNGGLQYFDGYLADVNFLDGITVGDTNGILNEFIEIKNEVCIPKKYSGSYGTNGYRLEFKKTGINGGTGTSSTVGADTANSNHYDSSGISSYDSNMPDSPENNFATLNPLDPFSGTLSEGNLKYNNGTSFRASRGTFEIPSSGKWYFEVLNASATSGSTAIFAGVAHADSNISAQPNNGSTTKLYGIYNDSSLGILSNGSQSSSTSNTISADSILQFAIDADNNKFYVGINNSYYTNATTSASFNASNPTESIDLAGYRPYVGAYNNTGILNCGQDPSFAGEITAGTATGTGAGVFKYAPPSGYLALCTDNLPEPTIGANSLTQADEHFKPIIWNGNSTDNTSKPTGHATDFLWIKKRDTSIQYNLVADSSAGTSDAGGGNGNVNLLTTSDNSGPNTNQSDGGIASFDDNGFTLGKGSNTASADAPYAVINQSSRTYVGLSWQAGGKEPTKTYKVVVVSDSGNKYRFRNNANTATFAQSAVTLDLQEGGTYTFDYSDSTATSHPFRFSTTSDGTHGGGSEYTTGVVKDDTAKTIKITVASSAPTLYYYCASHSGMGGQVNTNTTTGQTNFDGSILSVCSTNTKAGFSIVTATSPSSGTWSLGHGLEAKPDMVIQKYRKASSRWTVWHNALTSGQYLGLNETNGTLSSGTPFNFTFTDNVIGGNINYDAGSNLVSNYVYHNVEGYSKFGKYSGNNATDGNFIFTNFTPAIVIIKYISGTAGGTKNWYMWDNARSPRNVNDNILTINGYATEDADSAFDIDFLSNGFKLRNAEGAVNNGAVYIYMCWAENTFKYATAK